MQTATHFTVAQFAEIFFFEERTCIYQEIVLIKFWEDTSIRRSVFTPELSI